MGLAKRALGLKQSDPLRKDIESFLKNFYGKNESKKAIYKGKSKNIKSKEVEIISVQGDKTKIRDSEGNEALVASSQLIGT